MRRAGWASWIESRSHILYAVLAVPAVAWLALWMPPFQNPDEFEHFSRDTPLPESYYKAACVVSLLAVITEMRDEVPERWRGALWAGATLASFVVLVYAAVYITLTEVGAEKIIEVQGRYFLAAVPLVAWVVPPVGGRRPAGRLLRSVAWAGTIVFPLVSYAVVPWAIFARYYAP